MRTTGLLCSLLSVLATAPRDVDAGDELRRFWGGPYTLTKGEYNQIICYGLWPDGKIPSQANTADTCTSVNALSTEAFLRLVTRLCPNCSLQEGEPTIIFVGLGNFNKTVLLRANLVPTQSGRFPRVQRFRAMYIVDTSQVFSNSVEVELSKERQSFARDTYEELAAGRLIGFSGSETNAIAIGLVRDFAITLAPATLAVTFVRTNNQTLVRESTTQLYEVPPPAFGFELGAFLPFKDITVDRFSIRENDRVIDLDVWSPNIYLSFDLNFQGVADALADGIGSPNLRELVRTVFPHLQLGLGIPTSESRFFKTNSWFVGLAFPLGRSRFRLNIGRTFTELQVLDPEFLVGDIAPPGIVISDITERRLFDTFQFGISYSLPVFGK